MADSNTGNRHLLPLAETAEMLRLSTDAVEALVGAGFLIPADRSTRGPEFSLSDVKAFLARNDDNGAGNNLFEFGADGSLTAAATASGVEIIDPQDLLDALDGKSEDMARRAYEIFATVFPEAIRWTITEQATFIEQAKGRFEAILAVTGQGAEVDDALVGDLQEVGATAAWSGSPLPQLLVMLRISRDLVVQTAVELAEQRGRHWGLALSLLLTRVLPAMDRLTDALAQGYWAAIIGREEEARGRYENVVESTSDGIYEVDLDGSIQYANQSLAIIVGRSPDELQGSKLAEILMPLDPGTNLDALAADAPTGRHVQIPIVRADGVRRVLDVRTMARRVDDEVVGYQGIVRDETTAYDLEADKNEFLALVTYDLRNPLTTVLGLGATLESHAEELQRDRIGRMGQSIRGQAERIARLADDLYDVSRLEARSLLLSPHPVDLAATVEQALASVASAGAVDVDIPPGITVQADGRRLEQVVANLVENAIEHGGSPILVTADGQADDGSVVLAVTDGGPGVPAALVPTLFSGLRTLGRRTRDRSRGTGLGLALVRGLMEAMGGRVWYEDAPGGGASFRLTIPTPRRTAPPGTL
jgi:PAS domain S-box-containing protein